MSFAVDCGGWTGNFTFFLLGNFCFLSLLFVMKFLTDDIQSWECNLKGVTFREGGGSMVQEHRDQFEAT